MIATLFHALTEEVVSMEQIHTHAFVVSDTKETIVKSVRTPNIKDIPGYCDFHNQYPSSIRKYISHFLDIDECYPNPCLNNGTCIDGIADYTCNCTTGFGGANCENGNILRSWLKTCKIVKATNNYAT